MLYSVASVSRCLSSVTLRMMAKRCVLKQNLLFTAYIRSRIWEVD